MEDKNKQVIVQESRTKSVLKNSFFSVFAQCVILFASFYLRHLFIKTLGADLLGVSGVISNIIGVLSLAELGLGNSFVFALYKPFLSGDLEKTGEILRFAKKCYLFIGLIILVFGCCVFPFLPSLIRDVSVPMNDVYLYYSLFLLSTVLGYPFAFANLLFTVDQKIYSERIISLGFTIVGYVLQFLFLFFLKSYIFYLVASIASNFCSSFCVYLFAKKRYGDFFVCKNTLDTESKKSLFSYVKSMFIYKIFGVLVNNTDNILISVFCSTIIVGYLSNYSMVLTAFNTIINAFCTALSPSVGNLVNQQYSKQKAEDVFFSSQLGFYVLIGMLSICVSGMFPDFISLISGNNPSYHLDVLTIGALILNFTFPGLICPVWIFRDASGSFVKTKYAALAFCLLNIGLSILLGYYWGAFGVIIATSMSRAVTTAAYEPVVIFKNCFSSSPIRYFFTFFFELVLISGFSIGSYYCFSAFSFPIGGLGNFILKCCLALVFALVCIFFSSFLFPGRKGLIELIRNFLHHKSLA